MRIRRIGRVLLGLFLVGAGVGHFTLLREAFQAQVPPWLPFDKDFVVLASGAVEIALGLAVLFMPERPGPFGFGLRHAVGWIAAAFFVVIFPGNISQLVDSINAVGVEGSIQWIVRLFFQPLLVLWALWSTGAWQAFVAWWRSRSNRG
jgi:uncharacterized membrane protein